MLSKYQGRVCQLHMNGPASEGCSRLLGYQTKLRVSSKHGNKQLAIFVNFNSVFLCRSS